MPSVSVTWHTQGDDRVCPICRAINGYKWVFENEMPDSLFHPTFGEVWNIHLGSLAHEHTFSVLSGHKVSKPIHGLMSNCRCRTEGKIESLKDLADEIRALKEKLQTALGEQSDTVDDTQSGKRRKTTFEDIGIDPSKYGFE